MRARRVAARLCCAVMAIALLFVMAWTFGTADLAAAAVMLAGCGGFALLLLTGQAIDRRAPSIDQPQPHAGVEPPDIDTLIKALSEVMELASLRPRAAERKPVEMVRLVANVRTWHDHDRIRIISAPQDITVRGDRAALEHAFSILIENGLASGSRVTVRLDCGVSTLVAHIDDNGPGVPRDQRAHFFERVRSAGEIAGRRGAHLVTAWHILRAHDGDIKISSSPEGGARFSAHLPTLQSTAGSTLAA